MLWNHGNTNGGIFDTKYHQRVARETFVSTLTYFQPFSRYRQSGSLLTHPLGLQGLSARPQLRDRLMRVHTSFTPANQAYRQNTWTPVHTPTDRWIHESLAPAFINIVMTGLCVRLITFSGHLIPLKRSQVHAASSTANAKINLGFWNFFKKFLRFLEIFKRFF